MEESLCCYCQAHPAEIAAFPSDSSPKVSSICTSCMHRAELQGCTFVPSSCVQFTQTQAELRPEELERRGHGLNTQLSAYQRQVKQEAQIVKKSVQRGICPAKSDDKGCTGPGHDSN